MAVARLTIISPIRPTTGMTANRTTSFGMQRQTNWELGCFQTRIRAVSGAAAQVQGSAQLITICSAWPTTLQEPDSRSSTGLTRFLSASSRKTCPPSNRPHTSCRRISSFSSSSSSSSVNHRYRLHTSSRGTNQTLARSLQRRGRRKRSPLERSAATCTCCQPVVEQSSCRSKHGSRRRPLWSSSNKRCSWRRQASVRTAPGFLCGIRRSRRGLTRR